MAALKAIAVGTIAAIALPYLARNDPGLANGIFDIWTIHPVPGTFGLHFSIPIFLLISVFAWALFLWTEK